MTRAPANSLDDRLLHLQAILFDLDGTLIVAHPRDPARLARRLKFLKPLAPGGDVARLLRRLMLWSEIPSNYVLAFLERLGLDSENNRWINRLRNLKGVAMPRRSELVAGAAETLDLLRGRYRLGVVTSRCRRTAANLLEQHQLSVYFATVVTRQDTWWLKPHPAPVRHAAKQLGVDSSACAMVGDTPMDVQAAKYAGAIAIGVLSGFGAESDLRESGADLILSSVAALSHIHPFVL
jgi:phosphoglycolate phosphatase